MSKLLIQLEYKHYTSYPRELQAGEYFKINQRVGSWQCVQTSNQLIFKKNLEKRRVQIIRRSFKYNLSLEKRPQIRLAFTPPTPRPFSTLRFSLLDDFLQTSPFGSVFISGESGIKKGFQSDQGSRKNCMVLPLKHKGYITNKTFYWLFKRAIFRFF